SIKLIKRKPVGFFGPRSDAYRTKGIAYAVPLRVRVPRCSFQRAGPLAYVRWKPTIRSSGERGMMKSALVCLAFALAAATGSAAAQSYPSRPITIIIPAAAGGPADLVARVL